MATVGCLRCGVWYDPARPHLCGLLADETARGLAERIDAFERRLQGLGGEARSRFNALERRVQELEAGQERGKPENLSTEAIGFLAPGNPSRQARDFEPPLEPTKRFDRKANHRRYMREWRARQTARRSQQQGM